jgi:cobalt-zinc-cadmium efflux system outer membrane protein
MVVYAPGTRAWRCIARAPWPRLSLLSLMVLTGSGSTVALGQPVPSPTPVTAGFRLNIQVLPPDGGLTLDQAVDRFLEESLELRAMRDEIPMAQADVEAAGQPPQAYLLIKVGTNGIKTWHIQPRKLILKPWIQILAAHAAKRVLEAQYQDALRTRVDGLYTAFMDVVEAQMRDRYAEVALRGSESMLRLTQDLQKKGIFSQADSIRVKTEHEIGEWKLEEAKSELRKARLVLASMLNLPDAEVDQLRQRDELAESTARPPEAPPAEELFRRAMIHRPDLRAHRMGLVRAQLDWLKALVEPLDQITLQPWPDGPDAIPPGQERSAAAWGPSALVTLPTFVRNRGMLRRAMINVQQTRTELARVERQVGLDVRTARLDYEQARSAVDRFRRVILNDAKVLRDNGFKQYQNGEVPAATYFEAQMKYNDVVTRYLKEVIHLRRSKLALDTAVGEKIMR